ncbi:hypothetical protein CSA56_15980 [candidate division KSB3 bacterium]|uniref:DUF4382 domain-containing protein n=1 Tax=candidate division KSB3 bacterium TaxID=2044937 RepID=A0A2G6K9B1_9BACT|nr:MAG: hypothetical protein CSA56_15980 [candidate division KSB3 bacterium]
MQLVRNLQTRLQTAGIMGVMCVSIALAGCGKPGASSTNYTHSFVTVTSVNDNTPLQSDVLTDGSATDDIVTVSVQSESRSLGEDDDSTNYDGYSAFDTIVLYSYHVEHLRSDGGPNPADFTGGINLTIEPESEASADIVVVRAFDKNRSPLEELRDDGEMFTSTTITFYGEDGYGNDIAIEGQLSILFANYPD